MRAQGIMTSPPIAVQPDTPVQSIAVLLLERRISAVPVVDTTGKLVGIVSEGDLMRRVETGTEARHSWWLDLMADPQSDAMTYVQRYGTRAADVMTRRVVTVEEATPVADIVAMLERNRIKRVPVLRDGKVVGIVSRASILHGLATAAAGRPLRTAQGDEALRKAVCDEIGKTGSSATFVNVVARDGMVNLWGAVNSPQEHDAIRIAAAMTCPHGKHDSLV